ncbi:MAG: enoyl-CoA hydratase/isomerase family protein [Hyphomonadaceae bacterium]|jgi:2-(1,2-epoxy-1,2-dihydrophenyl)acetyl-CoA isomerase|nr:enoyl-CoA hydratase/isomerase family protein [Hyphomonadaceae bacterium]
MSAMSEPSPDEDILLVRVEDGVAWLTLNRPNAANTIDRPLAAAFHKAIVELNDDANVRALVLSGAGKMFCAGGDLQRFAREEDGASAYVEALIADFHAGLALLENFRAPVIAAVHGAAAGAGMGLALTADIVIAAENSRFVMAYTRAGLTPDGGTSWILPHLIGLRRALELTLLNRTLTAAEALDFGMITEIATEDGLTQRVQELARDLARGPTSAYVSARRLLRHAHHTDYANHLKAEAEAIVASFETKDGLEGVRAFRERRPPSFDGA